MTSHRLLSRASAAFATERWYNSQFVWDTWEPQRKRVRQSESAASVEAAGRLDGSGTTTRLCVHGALDREQRYRHTR